ncbi:VQ motif-containing protein 11, partial [Mucuna pruriens]
MAGSNSTTTYGPDPTTPNTTFVQADPSNFRAVVQKLTGASDDPSAHKLPLTLPSRLGARPGELIGPKKQNFKLHERRNAASKKLELSIGAAERGMGMLNMVMASPVSPLELLARGSPRTPHEEEEERAIAEKGFYLHPSPLSTPRASQPPELLPLFPLHSPTHTNS